MSRVGKQPIKLPKGVKASMADPIFGVEGPKGKLEFSVDPMVSVAVQGEEVVLTLADKESPGGRARHGLTRSILANMVKGVSEGFSKSLDIVGVGFRAAVKGENLEMALGYSHPVVYRIPAGIQITVEKNTAVKISGADRQLVGQTAAEIRAFREPEPYKGKGIKYSGEVIRRKTGKAAAATTGAT